LQDEKAAYLFRSITDSVPKWDETDLGTLVTRGAHCTNPGWLMREWSVGVMIIDSDKKKYS
jgi:hypothetical protein